MGRQRGKRGEAGVSGGGEARGEGVEEAELILARRKVASVREKEARSLCLCKMLQQGK